MVNKAESVDHQQLIENTAEYVKTELREAEGGHDWHHIKRVWKNALHIARMEKQGNLLVIELGALLHDIADAKFHNGDETIGPAKARQFLRAEHVDEEIIEHVINIIENISFRKRHINSSFNSIELQIVQDADRLDAIGAIGIARVFNFGGYKNRPLYIPAGYNKKSDVPKSDENENHSSKVNGKTHSNGNGLGTNIDTYTNVSSHTIGHFYEKLLLLSEMMNTETGRKLAKERHDFMITFLDQFYKEWNGNFEIS